MYILLFLSLFLTSANGAAICVINGTSSTTLTSSISGAANGFTAPAYTQAAGITYSSTTATNTAVMVVFSGWTNTTAAQIMRASVTSSGVSSVALNANSTSFVVSA